jgi:hypothetical protein
MASVLLKPYDYAGGNLIFDNFPLGHVVDTKLGKIRDRHVIVRDSVFPVTTLVGELTWRAERAAKYTAEELRNSVARLKSPSREIWVDSAGTVVDWSSPMEQFEIDSLVSSLLGAAGFVSGGEIQGPLGYDSQYAQVVSVIDAKFGSDYVPILLDATGALLKLTCGDFSVFVGDSGQSQFCYASRVEEAIRSLVRDDRTVAVVAFTNMTVNNKAAWSEVMTKQVVEFGRVYPRYKDLNMVTMPLSPTYDGAYDIPMGFNKNYNGSVTFMGIAAAFTWVNGTYDDTCLVIGMKVTCREAMMGQYLSDPDWKRISFPQRQPRVTFTAEGNMSPVQRPQFLTDAGSLPGTTAEYHAKTVARAPVNPISYESATLSVADWVNNRRTHRTYLPDSAVRYGYDVTVSPISNVSLVGRSLASSSPVEGYRYTVIECTEMVLNVPSAMMASYLTSLAVGASTSQTAEIQKVVDSLANNPTSYGIFIQSESVTVSPTTLDFTETSKVANKAGLTLRDEEMFPATSDRASQTFGQIEKVYQKRTAKPVSWYFFSKAVAGVAGAVDRSSWSLVWSYDVTSDVVSVRKEGSVEAVPVILDNDDPLLVTLHDWTRDGAKWTFESTVPGAGGTEREAWIAAKLFGTENRAQLVLHYSVDTSERGGEWDLDPVINSLVPVRISQLTPAQLFVLYGTEATDIARLALTLCTNWVQDGTSLPWDEQQASYELNPITPPPGYSVGPTT